MGFFILVTHKSVRSENTITWLVCYLEQLLKTDNSALYSLIQRVKMAVQKRTFKCNVIEYSWYSRHNFFLNFVLKMVYCVAIYLLHQSFEPLPPPRAWPRESGDNHLIFTGLCFPGGWGGVHFFVTWFSDVLKLSGGRGERRTLRRLKIRLTTLWVSRGFTFNLSVVAFSCLFSTLLSTHSNLSSSSKKTTDIFKTIQGTLPTRNPDVRKNVDGKFASVRNYCSLTHSNFD